jgi:hypothetical protein
VTSLGSWLLPVAVVVVLSFALGYVLPKRHGEEDVPTFFRGNHALGWLRNRLALMLVFGAGIAYILLGGRLGLVVGLAIIIPIALLAFRSARRWQRQRHRASGAR